MHQESPVAYYEKLERKLKIKLLEDELRFTGAMKML